MPYTRPYTGGFKDYPDTTTPINATALNTMDVGIKTANDQFQTVTTAQRTALSPTVGQAVWDSDLRQLMVYMNASGGNAWQPVGNRIVCTSTTRPSTPFEGQQIYETDTNKTYVYGDSAWIQIGEQPILTTVQKNALPAQTTGTQIYDSTLGQAQIWNGSSWVTTEDVTKPSPYQSIQRLAYQTATANYSISSTTLAGASNIFATSCTWTAAGSTAYRIELVLPNVNSGYAAGDYVVFNLVDGSGNDLGQIGGLGTGNGSQRANGPIHSVYYYTPAAGSVTINVRGVKFGTQNGNVVGGAGGSGATMPAFLAVFGPPIT